MVEKINTKIKLVEVLQVLEKKEYSKPVIFIDPNESLNTFFTYKGKVLNLAKQKLKLQANMIQLKDAEELVRRTIISALTMGDWLGFELDKNSIFDIKDYFSKFSFYKDDLFNTSNHTVRDTWNTNFKLLNKEEDKDAFGNSGFWKPKDSFKMCFISNVAHEDISEFLNLNSTDVFDVILIE